MSTCIREYGYYDIYMPSYHAGIKDTHTRYL